MSDNTYGTAEIHFPVVLDKALTDEVWEARNDIMGALRDFIWLVDSAPLDEYMLDGERLTGQCTVGSANQLAISLTGIIEDRGIDFDFEITEAPVYEFNGDIYKHLRGHGFWSASTDGDGNVTLAANAILAQVDAATDLTSLQHTLRSQLDSDYRFANEETP